MRRAASGASVRHVPDVRTWQGRLDVALASLVAVLAQLDVWGPRLANAHVSGSRPAVAAFYLATSLALLWRRRHPVAVVYFVALAFTAQFLSLGSSSGDGVLLPALVASYSVGAYSELRAAAAGLAAAIAVALTHELKNPNLPTTHAVVRAGLWDLTFVAAWLLGAYLRTRRLYVAELHERAVRAEREREEQARTAVADERARIARELHDAVAHGVSVMVVQAEAAEEMLDTNPPAARGALHKVQRSGREALVELRRLVGILRDDGTRPELAPQPGLADLDALVGQVREAGLPTDLHVEGRGTHLPPGIDLSAYRIVQEALTNVLKHAGPARATVLVRYGPDALLLEVSDDGRGVGAGANGSGHGLAGMRERVALYGGELEATGGSEGGFRVRAVLPIGGQ
jgi:signal transduction histidine kinase